jgi:hypothetical protein
MHAPDGRLACMPSRPRIRRDLAHAGRATDDSISSARSHAGRVQSRIAWSSETLELEAWIIIARGRAARACTVPRSIGARPISACLTGGARRLCTTRTEWRVSVHRLCSTALLDRSRVHCRDPMIDCRSLRYCLGKPLPLKING